MIKKTKQANIGRHEIDINHHIYWSIRGLWQDQYDRMDHVIPDNLPMGFGLFEAEGRIAEKQ
jgi:hypothetical protein